MSSSSSEIESSSTSKPPPKHPPHFRLTFLSLNLCVFLSTINTINLASALPTIASSLSATTSQAFWTSIILLFTQCITQPIYGTFCEVLGRKTCMVSALTIFTLSSLFAALAPTIESLIAARAIQGMGTGGINVCVNVLIVDLVPRKERAKMSGLVSLAGAVGLVAGVLMGSAAAARDWRVIFWVNLPLGFVPMGLFLMFLKGTKKEKEDGGNGENGENGEKGGKGGMGENGEGGEEKKGGWKERVRGMDWAGMLLFSESVSGILFALVAGGNGYAVWASAPTLTALVLGVVGLGVFVAFEGLVAGRIQGFGAPFIPLRLFSRRTAAFGFLVTFLHAMILWAIPYYYLLYLNISASRSLLQASILVLPSTFIIPIVAAVSGVLMSRLSHFKYFNTAAFALMVAGCGCLSTLRADPTTGQIIGFQFLFSIGGGLLFPGRLVAVQVAQRELPGGQEGEEDRSDVRMATSLVSFMTSLGQAFGIAMGSTALQSAWDSLLSDAVLRGELDVDESFIVPGSQAAKSAEIIAKFPPTAAALYRTIAAQSIARVWYACTALAAVGFLAAAASRNLSLQHKTEEEHEKAASGLERELTNAEVGGPVSWKSA
ncbi:major facilitator superfamily domain-containing protein [Immersiella caudata]|uniref:Major facilitator superfamily domain-containing protein n=1 Tax=Immersiella caudata TaxID=314043 RepID=A0AA40CAB1_9PEZI|nr:major facilitator superfamily domain-containing protein [Immersiella caudata]